MNGQFIDADNCLLVHAWEASGHKRSEAYDSIEHLLKGLYFALPEGRYFFDKEKDKRTDVRAKWWETDSLTYHELAIVPVSDIERIPHDAVDTKRLLEYDGVRLVFLGHYRLKGESAPLANHIACLDYSVARNSGGELCSYWFDDCQKPEPKKFIWVDSYMNISSTKPSNMRC